MVPCLHCCKLSFHCNTIPPGLTVAMEDFVSNWRLIYSYSSDWICTMSSWNNGTIKKIVWSECVLAFNFPVKPPTRQNTPSSVTCTVQDRFHQLIYPECIPALCSPAKCADITEWTMYPSILGTLDTGIPKWHRLQKTKRQTDHRLLSYSWNMASLHKLTLTCLQLTDNWYQNVHSNYISVVSGQFA